MKIVSWNVNGLESCRRNGFLKFIKSAKPDIVCCQETKVGPTFKINTPNYINYGIAGIVQATQEH